MRKAILILVVLAGGALAAAGQTGGEAKRRKAGGAANGAATEAAIRRVLDEQVAAWNRGDIDGFMEGYARSGETTFVSGDTVTRGWRTVLDRYKRRYDSREKMGALAFTDLETKPLASDAAFVTGRWQLARSGEAGPFARGRFTLVFRRTSHGWRIVHDHTSSAS